MGIGFSTVANIMYEFCKAILEISHQFIHFPSNGREAAIAVQKFCTFTESKIPQVVGVNDGTHIGICVDLESRVNYFSRKQQYTINTQAGVRANLMFLHIATGYPGSLHDHVYSDCPIFIQEQNEKKYLKLQVRLLTALV